MYQKRSRAVEKVQVMQVLPLPSTPLFSFVVMKRHYAHEQTHKKGQKKYRRIFFIQFLAFCRRISCTDFSRLASRFHFLFLNKKKPSTASKLHEKKHLRYKNKLTQQTSFFFL